MMESILTFLGEGSESQKLTILQVSKRAIIIFISALIIVRFANKRFFSKKTAFDFILSLILASMMARAINGAERLVPTIFAGFLLAFLHRALGLLACRWPGFGQMIKGHSETLITDGAVDYAAMNRHHLAPDDLDEELRLNGLEKASEVKLARLERSGDVSVLKK